MILVVCPNLAVDVTLEIDSLTPADVHRVTRSRRRAGGKGANLARAATNLGETAVVVGLAGGHHGEEIHRLLDAETFESRLIECDGESRVCTIAVEPNGSATVFNEPGPTFDADEASKKSAELIALVDDMLEGVHAVALMGSLQPGLPETLYRTIATSAMQAGKFCLVDTSGAALRATLAASPSAVKPNRAEAEVLLARDLDTESDCAEAVRELRRSGARLALLTRGVDGVMFSSGASVARCLSSPPPDMRFANPTGAGDALAAGVLVGHLRGFGEAESVRLGVAAATASLAEGYGSFRAKDLRPEVVHIQTLGSGQE